MKIYLDENGNQQRKAEKHDAAYSLVGGSVTTIGDETTYHSGQTPPTEKAIQAEMIRMDAEWDSQEYARNRRKDYPSRGDQLDMIYKDTKNSTTTHADAVEAVKAKWPKDNSGPVE